MHLMPRMPENVQRWMIRIGALLVLVAAAFGLRATVLAPDPVEVRVFTVAPGRVESTVTNSKAGTLLSRRRSRISAETGGRVTDILFREGDPVKKGDLLVRLNADSLGARLELAQAALDATRAMGREACLSRDLASRDLERNRELARNNVVSEDVLDRLDVNYKTADSACKRAASEVERSLANRRAARADLAKAEIRAPFNGVVAEINTEVGEWVTPSPPLLTSPAVVDLLDPKSIYVSAPMDEVDSSRIRAGQRVKISVDSRPGKSFDGSVERVAPYVLDIETQNRTVEVEAEFDLLDPDMELLVGTSADIEVILDFRSNALRIPTSALLEGERVVVFEEGLLAERSVTIGLRNWDFTEVRSGLEEGDLVVTSLDRKEIEAGKRARLVESSGADSDR